MNGMTCVEFHSTCGELKHGLGLRNLAPETFQKSVTGDPGYEWCDEASRRRALVVPVNDARLAK